MLGLKRLLLMPLTLRSVGKLTAPMLRDALPIMTFHRFANPDVGVSGKTPAELRKTLEYLHRQGIRTVSLADLADPSSRSNDTSRQIAFTVDDGYADFMDVAMPVFEEFDCPVSVFISTGVIDGDHWYWWDRLWHVFGESRVTSFRVPFEGGELACSLKSTAIRDDFAGRLIERLKGVPEAARVELLDRLGTQLEVDQSGPPPDFFRTLTWDEIRRCSKSGLVSFGPHSITHPALPMVSDEQARREIIGSWERLKTECPSGLPIFCYPFGLFSDREIEIVRESNMVGAVTMQPRYAHRDPFADAHASSRYSVPRFAFPREWLGFMQVAIGVERLKLALRKGADGWRAGNTATTNVRAAAR
jgi:peptidoglycan/xylan/chitin deacetylase (PgdA/CDA1 family)